MNNAHKAASSKYLADTTFDGYHVPLSHSTRSQLKHNCISLGVHFRT